MSSGGLLLELIMFVHFSSARIIICVYAVCFSFSALLTSNSELWFKKGEQDMLAMHHEFGVEW